jgi:hypothetical protein
MVAADLDALERRLAYAELLDREVAAASLAAAGGDGARVLARVAGDERAPSHVRVTALRHLPVAEASPETLRRLLEAPLPVIRVLALEKIEQARATTLTALVEALTRDPSSFWDLDEEIAVAEVAARVLRALESGPGDKG